MAIAEFAIYCDVAKNVFRDVTSCRLVSKQTVTAMFRTNATKKVPE